MAVYAFYSLRDGGEDFIGDGVEGFRHVLHGVFLSEDDDSVSYGGVYAAKVYHAHVHADVSYDGCHASVNPYFETSWREVAVETVGIAYGYDAYGCGFCGFEVTHIAYAFALAYGAYLREAGL